MINKEEFLKRLEEDTWFEEPDKLIEYRLPVVQYFMDNIAEGLVVINGIPFSPKGIQILYKEEDYRLVNQAFNSLKSRIDEFK